MKQKNLLIQRMIILFTMVLFVNFAFAQQTVTGTVTTDENLPLPGANVVVKGTTIGTMSDGDGNYTIEAPQGSTALVFSFIGMGTVELPITGSVVNCTLSAENAEIEEVVVIGYGQVKKNDATGSVSAVSSKDFNKGAITSAQDLLVGKSAGVVITTAGGAPGSGATIRIRGGSSLNASNDPLIIIDGVPLDNNNVSGSTNFLSFINPNDIETFTVLKDASATAIYGSRASNGVILITTKKGKVGSSLKISYEGNVSVSKAIKFLDVYSGDQFRQLALENADLYSTESFERLGTANTDWQNELFRTAISNDHNVSISGAYKILPYRVSLGYTNQNGIMKNTDLKRTTASISLDPSFFNNDLKININAKGMNTDNNFGDAGALGSAISMDPTQNIMDGNPVSGGYFQWVNYGAALGTANPVEQLLDADNKSNVKRLIGNVQFNYKLPFIPNLQANLNLATDYTESDGHNNRPITSPSILTGETVGKISNYTGQNKNNLIDFYLNYNKEISAIKSKIDLTGGYSWQHFEREGTGYTRGISDSLTSFITENYLISFFGRLNYTLMDKYLLTFTLRDDGSSRFAKENRWGLFPSVAFAWKIKEESFFKNVNLLSDLKLRLGWGVTGQQDIGNDYPAQARYIESAAGSFYPIGGEYIATLRPNTYDPNIKWEETTTQNIGLDFGFAKDRISGSVDLYKRVTDDMLNTVTVPSGSNFSNTLLTNVGSLENKGIELSLNLIPISKKDMFLNIGFNVTYNKNEITKLLVSDDPDYIGILYGDAFSGQNQVTRVGYPAYSFFVNQQVYDQNGNPIEGLYVDRSGEGGTVSGDNADKFILHNPTPDYLLGFSARFSYKNFDISASTRASIGNYVYNKVAAGSSYDQMQQIGYWKNFPTYLDDTHFVTRQFTSDYYVENASFFRLDNLSAGYKFNNIYKKLSARISFTVQNVLTVTKYSGLDPEVSGGIDDNFYPRPRTYMFGVSLNY